MTKKYVCNYPADVFDKTPHRPFCYLDSPCPYQNEEIKVEQTEQQWIPCAERMPEAFDRVLCFQPKALCNAMWIGHFDNRGFWVTDDGWEQYNNPVTAWMPLPELYKEGDE